MAGVKKRAIEAHPVVRTPDWTREEREREERARATRARQSRQQTPEERLEETLRLSRFISELRQGLPDDVRAG
jgi:hypothetical protein